MRLALARSRALVDGKAVRVSDVAERKWRIVSAGPLRVIVELSYKGWKVGGREVNLTSRMTQWAGERGFTHQVVLEGGDGLTLITGIVRQPDLAGEEVALPRQSNLLLRAVGGAHRSWKKGRRHTGDSRCFRIRIWDWRLSRREVKANLFLTIL